jgi:hypothetical protein
MVVDCITNAEHTLMLLGEARIRDALNDIEPALALYKKVLKLDASNVEAMACLAAHHFYTDQPEVALRFYRCAIMQAALSCGSTSHAAFDDSMVRTVQDVCMSMCSGCTCAYRGCGASSTWCRG